MRTLVNLQAKFILACPVTYVINKMAVFFIEIALVHIHVFQTCCIPTYFYTENTQVASRLPRKDLGKISKRLFAVLGSNMTTKSGFEQTNPTTYQTWSDWNVSWIEFKSCLLYYTILYYIILYCTLWCIELIITVKNAENKVCLFVWVLWHINLCRLLNAKSIFIQVNNSISNNSV